jgi:hypothetical protein
MVKQRSLNTRLLTTYAVHPCDMRVHHPDRSAVHAWFKCMNHEAKFQIWTTQFHFCSVYQYLLCATAENVLLRHVRLLVV